MRKGKSCIFHMRSTPFLALAVFLAAPALAQPDAAPALANFHGLTPTEIICMATGEDGQPEEVSSTPWEGGEIAADACPPGAAPPISTPPKQYRTPIRLAAEWTQSREGPISVRFSIIAALT